jgi:hypothetical protein
MGRKNVTEGWGKLGESLQRSLAYSVGVVAVPRFVSDVGSLDRGGGFCVQRRRGVRCLNSSKLTEEKECLASREEEQTACDYTVRA